jgi:hypothetical protein
MIPLVAKLEKVRANMVVAVTGPVDSAAAVLADDEVPHLWGS